MISRWRHQWNKAKSWRNGLAIIVLTLVIVTLGKSGVWRTPAAAPVLLPGKTLANTAYAKLPLIFEANQGQTDSQARFISRGPGYTLFITPSEAIFSLDIPRLMTEPDPAAVKLTTLHMRLIDANPQARVSGLEKSPTRVNYLRGQDRQQWRTGIPTYAKVQLQEVYPGIDLIYYGHQQQLEYDFIVAPGADPARIRLALAGLDNATQAGLADNGDLVLNTGSGEMRWHKPIIYQNIAGQRRIIDGGFAVLDRQTADDKAMKIGFTVAAYDRTQPLVIDPILGLAYSTFLGGITEDYGTSIAVDHDGNAYITGATASIDFPLVNPVPNHSALAGAKSTDVFVTKLNAAGTHLIYSTYLGGSDDKNDIGYGIALDDSGNAYITGMTASSDFPLAALGGGSLKGTNAFISIFDGLGDLLYSIYWGGAKDEEGRGIALTRQAAPNLWLVNVIGYTTSTALAADTPPFPLKNPFQPALLGSADVFVSVIDPNNETLRYSTYLGGAQDDKGAAIATDQTGNIYITGSTASTNFPVTGFAFDTTLSGKLDGFVAKINPDPAITGTRSLIYSAYLGGNDADSGAGIAVDSGGQAYITGSTASTDFPVTPAAAIRSYSDKGDAFITKFDANGTDLVYSSYLGGSGVDSGAGIVVTENTTATVYKYYTYVTGVTSSTNFPTTPDAFSRTLGGSGDAFVVELSESGAKLLYGTYLGGINGSDSGIGIADDSYGVYITGSTASSDFPVTLTNAFDTINGSSMDAFVTKFTTNRTITGVNLSGRVSLGTTPVCARVLANGVGGYSCDPADTGSFLLPNVPVDAMGQMTLFVWASHLKPYKQVFTPSSSTAFIPVDMTAAACSAGADLGGSASGVRQISLSGHIRLSGAKTPVCAAVLANGKDGFSCDGTGAFALAAVPVDHNGQVVLFAWADGFLPYTLIFKPSTSAETHDVEMNINCP